MKYKNAKEILPKELLLMIQQYTQGEFIYIPIEKEKRISWGEKNGTKKAMQIRNENILSLYNEGKTIDDIIYEYNLSESSVRKIISKMKIEYSMILAVDKSE